LSNYLKLPINIGYWFIKKYKFKLIKLLIKRILFMFFTISKFLISQISISIFIFLGRRPQMAKNRFSTRNDKLRIIAYCWLQFLLSRISPRAIWIRNRASLFLLDPHWNRFRQDYSTKTLHTKSKFWLTKRSRVIYS
jgi:hypothetical protein